MSSQAGPEVAQITELYSTVFTVNCCGCSVLALLVYEYLLTLDQEIRLFWKRKFTTASALFFVIRYWTLINYDLVGASTLARICALLIKAQAGITIFQYIPWAAFSALRVLALSGMRWTLAAIVFALGSGPAIVNFTEYRYGITGANRELCTPSLVSSVSRTSLIVSDILVIIVTIVGTWRRGSVHIGRPGKSSLGDVLLYNGARVLLILNILQVVLTHLSLGTVSQQASYITTISEPLTAIFISRFLIDLQAANRSSAELGTHTFGSLPPGIDTDGGADAGTLRFASRVIGPLGASTRLDDESAASVSGYGPGDDDDGYWEGGDDFDEIHAAGTRG
ncbi:hypothetical protein C8Q78DRAFT_1005790 [Trametes maxima]|nr:hypothetical protein C8Q78DRAFT_1005790 [Trametes maxima]